MFQRGYGKHEGRDSLSCNDLKSVTEPLLREIQGLQLIPSTAKQPMGDPRYSFNRVWATTFR
jgi:hypothetical protein